MKKHRILGAASMLHKLWTKQRIRLSGGHFPTLGGRFSDCLIVPRCCLSKWIQARLPQAQI